MLNLPKIFLCLLLTKAAVVSAAEYEVDGEIVQTLFKANGSVQLVEQSKFTVFIKDCSWLIQTRDIDAAGKLLLTRETSCVNNAEICEVFGKPNLNSATNHSSFPNVALTYSNTVPVGEDDGYFVSHLWLMFASGCYFANLNTNWITPVYDVNASVSVDPTLKREAKWELVNGSGSLPLNVVYLGGANLTNATYAATGVTNVGNLKFPSGFIFEQRVGNRSNTRFAPGEIMPGESASAYRVRKRTVVTVTAIRPVCSRSDLMATANGKTIVIDKRLAQAATPVPMSTYFVRTGADWVPVEAAKKMYISQPAPKKHSTKATAIFYALLLFPSAALLFFLIKTRRK